MKVIFVRDVDYGPVFPPQNNFPLTLMTTAEWQNNIKDKNDRRQTETKTQSVYETSNIKNTSDTTYSNQVTEYK